MICTLSTPILFGKNHFVRWGVCVKETLWITQLQSVRNIQTKYQNNSILLGFGKNDKLIANHMRRMLSIFMPFLSRFFAVSVLIFGGPQIQ
jgi:hypothetical protein